MAFWLKVPDPEPSKLFVKFEFVGVGNSARIAAAGPEISATGIKLPANAVRPVPSRVALLVGSYTWPPPLTFPKYWLRLHIPPGFFAGLHVLSTSAVGMVNWFVTPLTSRTP